MKEARFVLLTLLSRSVARISTFKRLPQPHWLSFRNGNNTVETHVSGAFRNGQQLVFGASGCRDSVWCPCAFQTESGHQCWQSTCAWLPIGHFLADFGFLGHFGIGTTGRFQKGKNYFPITLNDTSTIEIAVKYQKVKTSTDLNFFKLQSITLLWIFLNRDSQVSFHAPADLSGLSGRGSPGGLKSRNAVDFVHRCACARPKCEKSSFLDFLPREWSDRL